MRRRWAAWAGVLVALLCGCLPRATVPLRTVSFPAAAARAPGALVVFLPGRGSEAESFEREGFVAAARDAGATADLMAVDAHLGYYSRGVLAERLHEDVIAPARAAGYEAIWLVGISMGGTGALWYDVAYPGDVARVVVLAPYLGEPDLVWEIAAAGGVRPWNPGPVPEGDHFRRLWTLFKAYESSERTRGRLFLGYGRGDRFAPADDLLARLLPPDQVFTAEGDHDWETWRGLWRSILRAGAGP
ncbi:MAG: alpha/beta hydrolase [Deltaproteobacteria bacterium]|nr:alpha/beta hydrolase [Deltaproteobacteria bacterium]